MLNGTYSFQNDALSDSAMSVGTNVQPFVLGADGLLGYIWDPVAYSRSVHPSEIGFLIPGLLPVTVGLVISDDDSVVGVRLHIGPSLGLPPSFTVGIRPSALVR